LLRTANVYKARLFLRAQIRGIKNEAKYSYQISRSLSPTLLFVVILAYVGSAYIEKHLASLAFDTIWLRLFVASSLVPFLFRQSWPASLANYGYFLSTTTAGILFPLCFGTILLVNAALADGTDINSFATTEYILSLFFLVQVLFHIRLVLVVWTISTTLVVLGVLLIPDANRASVWVHCLYTLPFFLTVLLVGGIINRNLFNFQREKEQAVWNVANAIAHQLRTPLATIRNLSTGSRKYLPALTEAYNSAVVQGLVDQPLPNRKVEALGDTLDSIIDEVRHSGALIDILIANSKPFEYLERPKNEIHVGAIIRQAVEDYPYNNPHERGLVDWDASNDFTIHALENMVLHVMFNLIGNAVEFSQKRPKGNVKIWLENSKGWNKIIVRDSGIGIPKKYLHLVFDPFFSRNSQNGTGIGLSFCKSVMEGVGGKIECDSVEGEYCQFTLFFPRTAS